MPDGGIPCTGIVSWCSVPLGLVVKLGWVEFMCSSSSGGGRQSANDAKKDETVYSGLSLGGSLILYLAIKLARGTLPRISYTGCL